MSENIYGKLLQELRLNNQIVMLTKIQANHQSYPSQISKVLCKNDPLGSSEDIDFDKHLREKVQSVLKTGMTQVVQNQDQDTILLLEPFYPEARLIILGGGHIAKPLVKFGAEVGFSVTVVDDRPAFANKIRFPEARYVICESFEKCFDILQINDFDYIVIVTRGHRNDGTCLRQIISKEINYLGMIGSKRRVKIMKEQLIEEGISEEQLEKLNAPIGFEIGAVTPEEIAISIISQIICKKRLNKTSLDGKRTEKKSRLDFDYDILENLATTSSEPRALISIISTKGSVPRKAGAKMIAWQDGRTLGSIGGGCSEAELIQIARRLIPTGGYKLHTIDMTGELAEEEGMVCGGVMEVLIEIIRG